MTVKLIDPDTAPLAAAIVTDPELTLVAKTVPKRTHC